MLSSVNMSSHSSEKKAYFKFSVISQANPVISLIFDMSTFLNHSTLLCVGLFQFFASDERIKAMRKMVMAVTQEQRKAALDLLLPYQRTDFEGIFRAMDGTFCLL